MYSNPIPDLNLYPNPYPLILILSHTPNCTLTRTLKLTRNPLPKCISYPLPKRYPDPDLSLTLTPNQTITRNLVLKPILTLTLALILNLALTITLTPHPKL